MCSWTIGGGSTGFLAFSLPWVVTRASLGCCRSSKRTSLLRGSLSGHIVVGIVGIVGGIVGWSIVALDGTMLRRSASVSPDLRVCCAGDGVVGVARC